MVNHKLATTLIYGCIVAALRYRSDQAINPGGPAVWALINSFGRPQVIVIINVATANPPRHSTHFLISHPHRYIIHADQDTPSMSLLTPQHTDHYDDTAQHTLNRTRILIYMHHMLYVASKTPAYLLTQLCSSDTNRMALMAGWCQHASNNRGGQGRRRGIQSISSYHIV